MRRTIAGTSIWAGQALWQGASQSPTCSLSNRSSVSFLAATTCSSRVWMTIPSAAGIEQAGIRRSVWRSWTTQIIQDVVGSYPLR